MTHRRTRSARPFAALLSALLVAGAVVIAAPASAATGQLYSNLSAGTVGYTVPGAGIAASFVIPEDRAIDLTQVSFGMSFITGSDYTAGFAIYDDAEGKPGAEIAALGSQEFSGSTSRNVQVDRAVDARLSAGQRYWLVVRGDTTNGGWLLSASAPTGDQGITASSRAYFDGTVWHPTNSPYSPVLALSGEPVPTVTATITALQSSPTNAGTLTWQIDFSQAISGLKLEDFDISSTGGVTASNATLTPVGAEPAASWRYSLDPIGTAGTVRVDLQANPDHATISNRPVTGATLTIDRTAPTTTIAPVNGQSNPTRTQPIEFDVAFSEPVTGLVAADVELAGTSAPGAHVAALTGSGSSYRVTVDGAGADGTVVVRLPAGAALDAAGNGNLASSTAQVKLDSTAPAPTITSTTASPTDRTRIPVSIVFDETTSDLDPADVLVTNASVLSDSGPGQQVTLELEPAEEGTVTVTVPSGAVTDTAGNPNPAASYDIEFAMTSAGSISRKIVAGKTSSLQIPNPGRGTASYTLVPEGAAGAAAAEVSPTGLFTLRTTAATTPGAHAYTVLIDVDDRRFSYALDFSVVAAPVDGGGDQTDDGGSGTDGLSETGSGSQAPLVAGAVIILFAGAGALVLARRRLGQRK